MTSSGTFLGVGLIGSGFMGRTYAETVARFVPDARLVGVTCGSRAEALAKDYGIPHFPDLGSLLGQEDLDAVMIATPHALHAEQALLAAEAGKHMLIEKPMAGSVAECDAILAACSSSGLRCSIGFSQRTRTCNLRAKELLSSGELGKVLHIRATQLVPEGMANLPKWQFEEANLGTLFGHGIHNFDMIRFLTGQEIVAVRARCRSLDPNTPTEGTSDVLMDLSDGTIAYFFCSFQIPKPGFPRSQFSCQIACEKGLLDIDAYGELRVSLHGKSWEVLAVQEPIDWQGKGFLDPVRLQTYILHVTDFSNSIREGREPSITGWDGRQAVAAALAAYESSRTGREARPS
ncbi:MAG: Gfo/Idh/MocA family oxidoreductase [Candidatus Omnitrophica bacterium]|nr:Inositol 2-dehydrogenase/D-chiro-inositol 3-dehydrogenase [bacterium]NUN95289.1 Gfo/Idh/MocA family oxidoreductase [Candidatus Omnitrophota bacterium]